MTLEERRGEEAEAQAIGGLLRNAAEDFAPLRWDKSGLERLSRSMNVRRSIEAVHARWRRLGLMAAAFAVIVGGLWLVFAKATPPVLALRVEGADLSNAHYVVASPEAPAHLRFSDGSSVELVPNTRLRVQELTPQGATLALERGRAVAHVTHRPSAHWKLLAGPYEISVLGTQFQTDWNPTTETLTVDLFQGSLQIDGQRSAESALLQKGQRFRSVGHNMVWSISPIESAGDAAVRTNGVTEPTSEAVPLPLEPSAGAAGAAGRAAASSAVHSGGQWASAIAKGDFSRVVTEAESRGVAACLDQCSVADVRFLADAARYTRHFELAEQALNALRRRAPSEAPAAAYLLGALNESQGRSMGALRWYEQCVTEAPKGRFVSEAEAGRLRMLVATHQSGAARSAAQDYLRRYPHGVGRGTARKILESN